MNIVTSSVGVRTSCIESFSLLNDISPSTTVLDADRPIPNLHFTDVLFNTVIPSALRSSLYYYHYIRGPDKDNTTHFTHVLALTTIVSGKYFYFEHQTHLLLH